MKPRWDDPSCPEWANYLAKDFDETWAWHEKKPVLSDYGWESTGKIVYIVDNTHFKESLEERPKN